MQKGRVSLVCLKAVFVLLTNRSIQGVTVTLNGRGFFPATLLSASHVTAVPVSGQSVVWIRTPVTRIDHKASYMGYTADMYTLLEMSTIHGTSRNKRPERIPKDVAVIARLSPHPYRLPGYT